MGKMEFSVSTPQRACMVDITRQVAKAVAESGATEGLATVFIPHTTAGITIQENADPDVVHDFLWKLQELVPQDERGFRHSEGNSDAHIKASRTGLSQTILVADGQLVLGTWQGIYFCEYDGPRSRHLLIKCTSD